MRNKRVHVWVSGQVQGVSFRWYTATQAERLGVTGWVRNLPDGRVEAVFEGAEEAVDALVAWCRDGPSYASVKGVELDEEPVEGCTSFDIA